MIISKYYNFICDQENKPINNGQGVVFGIKVDVRKALKSRRRKQIIRLTRVKEYERPTSMSKISMYGH